jgi:hypothetical protein
MLPYLMALLALTPFIMMPALRVMLGGFRWSVPMGLLVLANVLVLYASFNSTIFDEEQRKPNSIVYAYNEGQGEAMWASFDPQPDEFTSQFLGEHPKRTTDIFTLGEGYDILKKEDSIIKLTPPSVQMLSQEEIDDSRYMYIQVKSMRDAEFQRFRMPTGHTVSQISIGKDTLYLKKEGDPDLAYFDFYGMPYDSTAIGGAGRSVTFTFFLPKEEHLDFLQIIEVKQGLGEVWRPEYKARRDFMMPRRYSPNTPTDVCIVQNKYEFVDKKKNASLDLLEQGLLDD